MKIAIPSKSRAGYVSTHRTFEGYESIIFVEPQDYEKYIAVYDAVDDVTIVNIKKNDMGIGYVRNFILDYMGEELFIMADDDIKAITKRVGVRQTSNAWQYDITSPDEAVNELLKMIEYSTLAGFVQEAYAHFVKKDIIVDSGFPIQLVMIDGKKLKGIRYDESLWAYEDVDFAIQLLSSGNHIAVSHFICYKQLKLKSNFFSDDTGSRNRLSSIAAEKLYEKWAVTNQHPEYLTLVKREKPEHRKLSYLRLNYKNIIK